MKTNLTFRSIEYSTPQVQVLGIVPETILCQSTKDSITGQTGASWSVGEDVEW